VGRLLSCVARNPDAAADITGAFDELTGGPFAYAFKSAAGQADAYKIFGMMVYAIALNPDAKTQLEMLFTTYTGLDILPAAGA